MPFTNAPSTFIYVDNQGAIKLTKNLKNHRKTKHIPINYHKIGKLVDNRTVTLN